MNKQISIATAVKPCFGMPVHASVSASQDISAVIRDRQLGGTTWADVAVTDAFRAFPGTPAWSPPTC